MENIERVREQFKEEHWRPGADGKLHPTFGELQMYVLETIAGERFQIVARHVENCYSCMPIVATASRVENSPIQHVFSSAVEAHTAVQICAKATVIRVAQEILQGRSPTEIVVPEGFWKAKHEEVVSQHGGIVVTADCSVDGMVYFWFNRTPSGWGEPCLVSPLRPDDDSDPPLLFSLSGGAMVSLHNLINNIGGLLFIAADGEQPLLFSWNWWKGFLGRKFIFRIKPKTQEEETALAHRVAFNRLPSAWF